MYCVECGSEGKLYEHLCRDCFLRKANFFSVPKVIKIKICSYCNAWEKSNHWEASETEEDAIKQLIKEQINVKTDLQNLDFTLSLNPIKTNIYHATLELTGKFEDLPVFGVLNTEIRISYSTCGRCSRQFGSYFEAKIQLRGMNRHLDNDELKQAEQIVDSVLQQSEGSESNAFLTKSEYIHGGEDFYIGSSTAARQIARRLAKEFAGKIKESSTLIGRKDGKDTYRLTFMVRVPEYKQGDFIELNNRIYQIKRIQSKHVVGLDLKIGTTQSFNHEALSESSLLGGSELIYDAVVVMESAREVQVLDPENYNTLDLIKPQNFQVKNETVKIFKSQDRVFLMPN